MRQEKELLYPYGGSLFFSEPFEFHRPELVRSAPGFPLSMEDLRAGFKQGTYP